MPLPDQWLSPRIDDGDHLLDADRPRGGGPANKMKGD